MPVLCSERLKFKPVPINAKLELGSRSEVPCVAEGRVRPIVRWYGGEWPRGGRLPAGVRDDEGMLAFDRVDRRHAGLYTCVASSQQGTIDVTIRVDVIGTYHIIWSRDRSTNGVDEISLLTVYYNEPAAIIIKRVCQMSN